MNESSFFRQMQIFCLGVHVPKIERKKAENISLNDDRLRRQIKIFEKIENIVTKTVTINRDILDPKNIGKSAQALSLWKADTFLNGKKKTFLLCFLQ